MLSLAVGAALVAATAGCSFQASQEGQEGNLEFQYNPADGETDRFDRPIAVGSGLTMEVEPLGRAFDEIEMVTTSPAGVIEAWPDGSEPDLFHLEAIEGGDVEIEVQARGDGSVYTDRIEVAADEVAEVEMGHRCTDFAEGAYPRGAAPTVQFDRRSAGGDKLIGGAENSDVPLRSCQAWVTPEDLQTAPVCDEAGLHFPEMNELEIVELDVVEEVGLHAGGASYLDLYIYDPDATRFEQPGETLRVDRNRTIEVRPYMNPATREGTVDVCAELEVEVRTPGVCELSGVGDETTTGPDDDYEVRLSGNQSGICDLDVYLADQRGVAPWTVSVDVLD